MSDLKIVPSPKPPAPGAIEVSVTGSIVSGNVASFQSEMDRLIGPSVRVVVLGLKDVGHISSAPLAYLVAVADKLERQGGLVILLQTQPKILQIMDTLGLRSLFKVSASPEEARSVATTHAEKLAKSPRLVQVLGGKPGLEYPILAAKLTLGSDPKNTIVLSHHQVEPRHAEIYRAGEQVVVKDLGSRFGTFVDGKRVQVETPLAYGKTFSVASFLFKCLAAGEVFKP